MREEPRGERCSYHGHSSARGPYLLSALTSGTLQQEGFAKASVAGDVSKWTEVGGRCLLSPSAMHDHVMFVCKLVGDRFPWGLAWLLALALALLCSREQSRRPCRKEGSVKWQVTGIYGSFTPANE